MLIFLRQKYSFYFISLLLSIVTMCRSLCGGGPGVRLPVEDHLLHLLPPLSIWADIGVRMDIKLIKRLYKYHFWKSLIMRQCYKLLSMQSGCEKMIRTGVRSVVKLCSLCCDVSPPSSLVRPSNSLPRFCFFLLLDFSMVSSLISTRSILDTMLPITPSIRSTRFVSLRQV